MTFARARHIAFLVCVNNPPVLTGGVKFGQSEGIPDSGIPERFPLRKFHRRSLVLSPSLPSFFPALSLALFFARAPLSERLEQARFQKISISPPPPHGRDWNFQGCGGGGGQRPRKILRGGVGCCISLHYFFQTGAIIPIC